ncbi:MAG TPA: hypothetical protein VL400_09805, partial [Polyangiaceae bacterium]|nr:hypothetical protein [Polyangiaceae bacterium]
MTTTAPSPPVKRPRVQAWSSWLIEALVGQWRSIVEYFRTREPTFRVALLPMLAIVTLAYVRPPNTNYIFDEQEALLGNPYVNQKYQYEDAIYRDFWGLPPNASIGSYRPIPDMIWRGWVEAGERAQRAVDKYASPALQQKLRQPVPDQPPETLDTRFRHPFFQQFFNLIFHGICGALFTAMAWRVSRRRLAAWLTGLTFVTAAILTEAVSGVVGLADILGGLGALLALAALDLRAHAMPFGVFLALSLGLFSKESAIVCVPLVPVAALLFSPVLHPHKPARVARALLAAMGALAA